MNEVELEGVVGGARDPRWKPSESINVEKLPSRKSAFRQAKRDAKIPICQSPDKVSKVDMTEPGYAGGHKIKDNKGKIVSTREYSYMNAEGDTVVIQEHSYPHIGSRGAHFNVRPKSNTRTGKVPGTDDHYPFK